uniref:SREBP regulating gene protein n=1 Tax=Phallusia mammillata TaxID=59560 RepID=A0A6F9D8P1_9ASCI|nr:UPF0454 protein C12orf49 homolog [Phallusia mammillata]
MLRSLRKRWVLFAIFFTSLLYFAYNVLQPVPNIVNKDQNHLQVADYQIKVESVLHALKWHVSEEISENNGSKVVLGKPPRCRNSLQGKSLIADEKGYVCKRIDVSNSGCCDFVSNSTFRYQCSSCMSSNCCFIYEHCVSCCMHPNKKSLLEKVVRESGSTLHKTMFLSIHDQFELCLSKCRTSSSSVQHENMYRNTKLKYCFGVKIPDLKIS